MPIVQQLVSVAVAFGDGNFQSGVIVQHSLAASSDGIDEFKSSIWPTVLEGNELVDAHARIAAKDAIILVPYTMTLRSNTAPCYAESCMLCLMGRLNRHINKLNFQASQKGQFVLDRNRDITQQLKNLVQSSLPEWNVAV